MGVGCRGPVGDVLVGERGQLGEDLAQVGVGVDALASAVFDDRVEDGSALARIDVAHEEPVLLSNGSGTDGVFDEVVVDLHAPVLQEHAKAAPLTQGVVDGFAQGTLRQVALFDFQSHERPVDAFVDGTALTRTDGLPQPGSGALFSQPFFNRVKMADLPQEPADEARGLFLGFDKFAARMGVAGCEPDSALALPARSEAAVACIPVALDNATEVRRDDFLHAVGRAACVPVEDDVAAGPVAHPKVSGICLAVAGGEVGDGRFVHLDVVACDYVRVDLTVDDSERVLAQVRPAPQGLPGDVDFVACAKDLLLSVEWQVAQ